MQNIHEYIFTELFDSQSCKECVPLATNNVNIWLNKLLSIPYLKYIDELTNLTDN